MGRARLFIALMLLVTLVSSCGYSLHQRPAMDSVAIGEIQNSTFEHGMQDVLKAALARELMKNSIRVDPLSAFSLSGAIESVNVSGTVEKWGIAVVYEVKIKGRFRLSKSGGPDTALSGGGLFPVSFSGIGALEEITALRDKALAQALDELAVEIVESIVNLSYK